MEQEKIKQLEEDIQNQRKRIITERLDISFGELINLYRNGELIIRPEYQRLYRWTDKQKTELMESILLSIPIPPIFVSENDNGVWELVDGLQRIATFISFFGELNSDPSTMNNEPNIYDDEIEDDGSDIVSSIIGNNWTLEAGGIIKSLEGFDIKTLPTNYILNLKRAVCRVEILKGEGDSSIKYELFKRLNSCGTKLTQQEIRNAIYRAINPKLNELLQELSTNNSFTTLVNLSRAKKQELYDQELILRFFAFLGDANKINDNISNYLDKYMKETVSNDNTNYEQLRNTFSETMELILSINDTNVFKRGTTFVAALFEGISVGIANNINTYKNNTDLLIERINTLKSDESFKTTSGTASSSKNRTKNRLTIANNIFSN